MATEAFSSIETRLHEHLAQLLTYNSLRMLRTEARHKESRAALSRIIRVFGELNKHQPPDYVIDDYLELSTNWLIESIQLLKKEWLKGSFEAWKTVVKW